MSVLERLNQIVRANLNHLSSRAAGDHVIGDVRDNIREARAQLVESRVAERSLVEEYEALLDESQSWEDRAVLALRANDEPLARRALERKQRIDRRVQSIKQQLDGHRAHATDLMRSLEAIEVKLEALRDRGRTPTRRLLRADPEAPHALPVAPPGRPAQDPWRETPLHRTASLEAEAELGGFGNPETFDAFDEMSDRLTHAEAELDAVRELRDQDFRRERPDDDLESRFRRLEAGQDLTRLKQRAGNFDDLRRRLEEE